MRSPSFSAPWWDRGLCRQAETGLSVGPNQTVDPHRVLYHNPNVPQLSLEAEGAGVSALDTLVRVQSLCLTCDIEPHLAGAHLDADHSHHVVHGIRLHDGEVKVGLVESQRLRGRAGPGDPADVKPHVGGERGAAAVRCLDLPGEAG